MGLHTLAPSTHTVEMLQVIEINDRLACLDLGAGEVDPRTGHQVAPTAEFLGLTGAHVHPRVVDRAAAAILLQERQHEILVLPGAARLRSLLAAGDPSFPYLYGIFGEPDGARRRLPAVVHTEHLRAISSALQFRHHRWGV
jgi:hypothetical protein